MMFSADWTVRNANPACVTTPNSTSPAKYRGAMMSDGKQNVAKSYAFVNSVRFRIHATLRYMTAATDASAARAFAASRFAPRYSAMLSACSRARTNPKRIVASRRNA
eukprot:31342-Pelagococcus_subviridis.AAC.8